MWLGLGDSDEDSKFGNLSQWDLLTDWIRQGQSGLLVSWLV